MSQTLELVTINNQLAIDVKKTEVKTVVMERLMKLGLGSPAYRGNTEFLLLVCNLVEHLVNKKKYKIDKKELVIDIIHQLFILTGQERTSLENNIEFLHSNKNIKKLSKFALFCAGVKEYFGYKKKL